MKSFAHFIVLALTLTGCACTSQNQFTSGRGALSNGAPKQSANASANANVQVDNLGEKASEPVAAASGQAPPVEVEASPSPSPTPDLRSNEELICQEGPRIANAPKKDDFTELFAVICDGPNVNAAYKAQIAGAWSGTGEPPVTLVSSKTGDLFVTKMIYVYAVKVPVANPGVIADINLYAGLTKGVSDATSRLGMAVDSRTKFPGRGSLEEVVVNYNLEVASLAGVNDKRRTAINNYLLKESSREVMIATEYLLEPEKTEFYHNARGLQVMVKAQGGENATHLLYINELTIKNRIDPLRVQTTVLNLSKGVQKTIYKTIVP